MTVTAVTRVTIWAVEKVSVRLLLLVCNEVAALHALDSVGWRDA